MRPLRRPHGDGIRSVMTEYPFLELIANGTALLAIFLSMVSIAWST